MSNMHQMPANEQLLTELTAEEGAAVSGGLWNPIKKKRYHIGNKTRNTVPYLINHHRRSVSPGRVNTYTSRVAYRALISFDRDPRRWGVSPTAFFIKPGSYNFKLFSGLRKLIKA